MKLKFELVNGYGVLVDEESKIKKGDDNSKRIDMKNIHVLPTDKPSRLHLGNSGLVLCDLNFCSNTINGQNIYITFDEEIKEGDWFIQVNTKKRIKHHLKNGLLLQPQSFDKKIILTTDVDLIKDGVQSIPDEFLEWFIKNPNCESVEVESFCKHGDNCPSQGAYDKQDLCDVGYKIIIPNLVNPNNQEVMFHEEHQEYFHEDFIDGKKVTVWLGKDYIPKEEPKQETLEEAAEKLILQYELGNTGKIDSEDAKEMLIEFITRQAERMYSEEDMEEAFQNGLNRSFDSDFDRWFEQFKKK